MPVFLVVSSPNMPYTTRNTAAGLIGEDRACQCAVSSAGCLIPLKPCHREGSVIKAL